ncbi:copper amine oxidase N-terminal domain-containing protein [Caloranaerobacter sp. DY30410]|uniref:copper amine oxidase N-terminal domain-containing protein n=1 Tax=Caloranaerobacter sp. DY30410 TaxID=3238305 RepID=UPI003CFE6DDF
MKKISIFLVIILLMNIAGPLKVLADEQPIKVSINGKLVEFDVPPTIINGRTLVPVRAIFEQFGLEVDWDNETRTVIGKKDGLEIKLPVDNKKAQKNDKEIELDVPATIINGRTLVPVRFIAESLGAKVDWDRESKTVIISNGYSQNDTIPMILFNDKAMADLTRKLKEVNGTVFVPIKDFFTTLHMNVTIKGDMINIIGKYNEINMNVGSNVVDIGDNTFYTLNQPVIKIDEKIYMPFDCILKVTNIVKQEMGTYGEENKLFSLTRIKKEELMKNNPFTLERLTQLVENTPVDKEILEFRKKPNKRRNGLKKIEGKYFDLYYPDDDKAKEVAEFLKPYMDTAYIYLVELYGQQAPVEVHLIHEKDAENLKEGDIRAKEKVTFVWIEPNNDDGGNNIAELVHEMHHNFFSYVNNDWSWADDKWSSFVDEALAKLLPSLYVKNVYDGKTDMWDIESDYTRTLIGIRKLVGNDFVTLDEAVDKYLGKPSSWGRAEGRHRVAQNTALAFWMYVYNEYGIEKIKEVLRTIGKGNYKSKLQKIFNKSTEELSDDLINAMNEA